MFKKLAAISALVAAARAQQACSQTTETHPSMTWQRCSDGGSCTSVSGSVVLDANWRWTHILDGTDNCYDGNSWVSDICTDGASCAEECCVDGADYSTTYGISASGDTLDLTFVTEHEYGTNIGSRLYLMSDEDNYEMFDLLGNEFTFDVDVSNLPCGLNGALYFVSMEEDGGMASYDGNNAGAKYGTGYCDSQCPRDVKFIGGEANVEGWEESSNDANAGVGNLGACCSELDIWEANSIATAYTPHPCEDVGYHVCEGDSCGGTYSETRYAGDCDPDGCDFNSYRQGDTTYYGAGMTVDTTQTMTVVTQFYEESGVLSEIKRFYVQNGEVIPNSESTIEGVSGNSITEEYCTAQKVAFGDEDVFSEKGGLAQMGAAMDSMVLVMSLWDDHYANMLWLDSTYPVDASGPGAERGSCSTDSGVPADVEANSPDANVVFSNIKFGPIGSTFDESGTGTGGSTTTTTSTSATATATSGTDCSAKWGQCGGNNWSGATCCSSSSCTYVNDWYSQCL
ncbi:Exoglucanase 1 [Zalerion maritima]|uniref:Glucanase n=1 Tax=Zalerion maritima TaxID=339359 RepID=A0AAD5WTP0_9PEZI|nr:Exoglucanase 1 [Zalerion maritima]